MARRSEPDRPLSRTRLKPSISLYSTHWTFEKYIDFVTPIPMQAEADWGSRPITVETFTDCVNLCTFDEACEFLQFNYAAEEGNCRLKVALTMATTR
jgi:hypothetical protein